MFAVVVAPVTEEFLFRGLIYRSIRDRHGVALGAIVSALLFGVIHYVPGPWPDALALQITMVVTGLGLASVYEWRKTLLAPIVGPRRVQPDRGRGDRLRRAALTGAAPGLTSVC